MYLSYWKMDDERLVMECLLVISKSFMTCCSLEWFWSQICFVSCAVGLDVSIGLLLLVLFRPMVNLCGDDENG